MAGVQGITVRWAGEADAPYIASLCHQPPEQCLLLLQRPEQTLFIIVEDGGKPSGLFFAYNKPEAPEVHMELALHGRRALTAIRLAWDLFSKTTGITSVQTFVTPGHPATRMLLGALNSPWLKWA